MGEAGMCLWTRRSLLVRGATLLKRLAPPLNQHLRQSTSLWNNRDRSLHAFFFGTAVLRSVESVAVAVAQGCMTCHLLSHGSDGSLKVCKYSTQDLVPLAK